MGDQPSFVQSTGWKRAFAFLWTGQALSLFGSMIVQFALVWWLTRTTGRATVLATAMLVGVLPGAVLGPFIGALVDRWNRKAVMILSDSLVAVATLGLVWAFGVGAARVWHVYLVMFLRALAGAFEFPAMQASTSLMVPERHLGRMAGLNQALNGGLNIVAPPLGAMLVGLLPMHRLLMVDIVTAALAVGTLAFLHIPQPEAKAPGSSGQPALRVMMLDVREGLRYVRGWPGLMVIIAMSALVNMLFSPISALTPLLVTRHFRGGALELGWTDSAWGAGVVAGGLVLGIWGGFRRQIYTALTGLIGLGLGTCVVGFAPGRLFGLALFGMAIAGLMIPMANGPILAVLQKKVEPDMQGRVFTLLVSMSSIASPVGLLLAGPISDRVGIQAWYVVVGLVCVLMGIGAFAVPIVRTLEDQRSDRSGALEREPLHAS